MTRSALPCLLTCTALLTAAACKDTSPPTWTQDAKLSVERADGAAEVEVSWPAATDNEGVVGYELTVDQAPPVAVSKDATSHTLGALTDAADHKIFLRARDEIGNWSVDLTARLTIPDLTPPTWPVERFEVAELDPTDKGTGFKFSWEPASDQVAVTGYLLTRGGSDFKAELGPEIRDHTVEGPDIEGFYSLRALDRAGNTSAPQACNARSTRLLDRQIAADAGILKLLSADTAKLDGIFGRGDLGSGISDEALGGLIGSEIGDAGGFGGLGMRGTGSGGGGGLGMGGLGRPREKVPGGVTSTVTATSDGIEAVVAKRAIGSLRGALKACYEKRLKQDPAIDGDLELTLSMATGKVSQIEATGGSLQDAGTRSCVKRVLRRTRLPGVDGSVSLKLVFSKS